MANVDAGADAARGGERLGDGLDDTAVGVADALLDECGEAAQVIDAERLCRAVLTPEYAKQIGADYYAKDAAESARIAEEVFGQ